MTNISTVILVSIDCFRYDRCGFNGYHQDTTPVLDALAEEAAVFDSAYSTGPDTTESVPGILAGLHSNQCSYLDNLYWKAIPGGAPTVAGHLSDHGFETVAMITNQFLGGIANYDRGFNRFCNLRFEEGRGHSTPEEGKRTSDVLYRLRESLRSAGRSGAFSMPFVLYRYHQLRSNWPTVPGRKVVDRFTEQLTAADSPSFGWCHFMDLHGPLNPDTVNQSSFKYAASKPQQFRTDFERVSNHYTPHQSARYDSAIRYVDDQIGRLVNYLQDAEVWDETALIVTADHGEALYDRGIYGHEKHYMYGELLHVPLLVRTPSLAGRRIDRPFSLAWLHELIAEVAGLDRMDAPASTDRVSHLVTDEAGEYDGPFPMADAIDDRGRTAVVRDNHRKYISNFLEEQNQDDQLWGQGEMVPGYVDGSELYRIDVDPKERRPVERGGEEGRIVELAEKLLKSGRPEPLGGRVNDKTQERLKDLGYHF